MRYTPSFSPLGFAAGRLAVSLHVGNGGRVAAFAGESCWRYGGPAFLLALRAIGILALAIVECYQDDLKAARRFAAKPGLITRVKARRRVARELWSDGMEWGQAKEAAALVIEEAALLAGRMTDEEFAAVIADATEILQPSTTESENDVHPEHDPPEVD